MDDIKNHMNKITDYIKNIEDENKTMKDKVETLEAEMKELTLFLEKEVNNIKIKSSNKIPLKTNVPNMERIKKYFDKRRKNRKSLIIKRRYYVDSDFDSDDDCTSIKLLQYNTPVNEEVKNNTQVNEEVENILKDEEVKEIDIIKNIFKDDLFNFTKK